MKSKARQRMSTEGLLTDLHNETQHTVNCSNSQRTKQAKA